MNLNHLSPIVIFLYNRPEHSRKTLEALKNNYLASQSKLFIFIDGPRSSKDIVYIDEVELIATQLTGFKEITIVRKKENFGLAKSIISGVTDIVNKYGNVIVLEDDLVTSKYFLEYMNKSLSFYENEKDVWHISGWTYPINTELLSDVFLWRTMNCWGWATWSDRWHYFNKDTDFLLEKFTDEDIYNFNLSGSEDFWCQVIHNKKGLINTWAIYWYSTIFLKNGLCLNPAVSLVENIGLDGSGEHCNVNDNVKQILSENSVENIKTDIFENRLAVELISEYLKNKNKDKNKLFFRLKNKISRLLRFFNIKEML